MTKHVKWILSFVTAFMMTVGIISPSVSAQETNWDEVLTELNEVNQDVVSMEGDGAIHLDVADVANGSLTFDFRYNIDPAFAAEVNGAISGELMMADEEGNMQAVPLEFAGQAAVVDSVMYFFDGTSWIVEDISEIEEEFEAQFNQAMAQAQEQAGDMTASVELTQKYFDLTETDTEYVMVLQDDINPDEFLADIEQYVDIEQIKQESLSQAIEQAEAAAEAQEMEFTEADRQEMEAQFEQAFDAGIKLYFQIVDRMEIRYAKDTYYVTHMGIDLTFTEEDFAELAAEMGESSEGMEGINIALSMEFNFDNHGEVFDITVPADAPTFDEAEGDAAMPEDSVETTDELEEADSEESVE